ncbi:MAG: hypothetical protein IPK63_12660 [Candidatus Competibacteraceae bacterium]|nr:hypothetical protein [Candidatus Competibacteraceae bacterium]
MKENMAHLACCQYLPVSQIDYTLTHFADQCELLSYNPIKRELRGKQITPGLIWGNVRGNTVPVAEGYGLFDDTLLDKNDSQRNTKLNAPSIN